MSNSTISYDNYFIKHTQLDDIGKHGQTLLRGSLAVVFGAGAIGLPVLQTLLTSGIGRILLIDPDVVEASNLHRQFVYNEQDIGSFKVDCASSYARSFPHTAVATLAADVSDNVEKVIRNADIVFECTDSHDNKLAVAKACMNLQKPLVVGSLYKSHGTVTLSGSQSVGCYGCVASESNEQDCSEDGVFAPFSMYLGALQANLGLRLLLQDQENNTVCSQYLVDGSTMTQQTLHISKDPGCTVCGGASTRVSKSSPKKEPDYVLVVKHYNSDRNPMLVKLNEPEDVLDWDLDTSVSAYIVACPTGKRAGLVAELLKNKGFDDVYVEPLSSLDIKL